MAAYILTDAEQRLAVATEDAGEIDFALRDADGRPTTIVRAETLRRILLSLPVTINGFETVVNVRGPGIRITNALIEGKLDLDNACAVGGDPLSRLSLIECYIPEIISLRAAKMRRLCLKNSWISYLRANDTVIGTQLDLEGVKSANSKIGAQDHGRCRVALRGAQIEDGIEARGAVLVSPPARQGYTPYDRRSHYALDLSGARIGGDLRLFPSFQAIGGINMAGCEVSGSVQMHGAQVTAEEVHGIDLEGAHIQGHLDLCSRLLPGDEVERCVIKGDIHLSHARIDDGVKLNGTLVTGQVLAQYLKVGSDIDASGLAGLVEGKRHNQHFECGGDIVLNGARLEGNLDLCGALISGAINASTSTIGGNFAGHTCGDEKSGVVHPLRAAGPVRLEGSHIAGDLDLSGAQLGGDVQAKGLNVGGFFHMRSDTLNGGHTFRCKGQIEITNAQIGLGLHMSGAVIDKEMYAQNIRSGGHVLLCAVETYFVGTPKDPFVAHGRVSLAGAEISGDLNLLGAYLHKGIRCRGTNIRSALLIELMRVPFPTGEPHIIDMTNARTNVLLDGNGNGKNYGDFRLDLEGFEYGRFGLPIDAESALRQDRERDNKRLSDDAWSNREKWLERQKEPAGRQSRKEKSSSKASKGKSPSFYKADTYNTLYRVLKDNGYAPEANKVLSKKLNYERKRMDFGVNYILMTLYGAFFGFGLGPRKALASFATVYILVFLTVLYANLPGTAGDRTQEGSAHYIFPLTEVPIPDWASPFISAFRLPPGVLVVQSITPNHIRPAHTTTEDFVAIESASRSPHEVPCGERLKPMLYTLDLIVPAVDLHQVDRCDLSDRGGPLWSILKALATLIGWIVTSLTVLTLSGILRRQIEPN